MNLFLHKCLTALGLFVLVPLAVFEFCFFGSYLMLGPEIFGFEIPHPWYSMLAALVCIPVAAKWVWAMAGHVVRLEDQQNPPASPTAVPAPIGGPLDGPVLLRIEALEYRD